MSSKIEHVKHALGATVKNLISQIETSYRNKKIPADYSLGFVNALIWVNHELNFRPGKANFYDRKICIGELPKPVVLKTDSELMVEKKFDILKENICEDAIALMNAIDNGEEKDSIVDSMQKHVADLAEFLEEKHDGNEKNEEIE